MRTVPSKLILELLAADERRKRSRGLLGDEFQSAERVWRTNQGRKSLIKWKVKSCCEQTIKTSKMLRKPVTFMERAVISLSASQIYSVEVGQAVGAYLMN